MPRPPLFLAGTRLGALPLVLLALPALLAVGPTEASSPPVPRLVNSTYPYWSTMWPVNPDDTSSSAADKVDVIGVAVPAGPYAVFWADGGSSPRNPGSIHVFQTWDDPQVWANKASTDLASHAIWSSSDATPVAMSVAINEQGYGVLVFSANDYTENDFDIFVSVSYDMYTWSTPVYLQSWMDGDGIDDLNPQIVYDNSSMNFHVVWTTSNNGSISVNSSSSFLAFSLSNDTGSTWSNAVAVNAVNDKNVNAFTLFPGPFPGDISVIYEVDGQLYTATKSDSSPLFPLANTYALPASLRSGPQINDTLPTAISDGKGHVLLAWKRISNLASTESISIVSSNNSGLTFPASSMRLIAQGSSPFAQDLSMATDTRGIFVLTWTSFQSSFVNSSGASLELPSGEEVFYAVTPDWGQTFGGPKPLEPSYGLLNSNGDSLGTTFKPFIFTDTYTSWIALYLSTRSGVHYGPDSYSTKMTINTNGKVNVFFSRWFIDDEMCEVNSPAQGCFCQDCFVARIANAAQGATVNLVLASENMEPYFRPYEYTLGSAHYILSASAQWNRLNSAWQQPVFVVNASQGFSFAVLARSTGLVTNAALVYNLAEAPDSAFAFEAVRDDQMSIGVGYQSPYDGNYLACPWGFRPPDDSSGLCVACPAGLVCAEPYLNASNETVPCPAGYYCPPGTGASDDLYGFPCDVGRVYSPSFDTGFHSASQCLVGGAPCAPFFACAAHQLTTTYARILQLSPPLTSYHATIVFPSSQQIYFNVTFVPDYALLGEYEISEVYLHFNDLPAWLSIDWLSGWTSDWGLLPGHTIQFRLNILSNAPGVPLSEDLNFMLEIDFTTGNDGFLPNNRLGWAGVGEVISVTRTVTTVIFQPSDGLSYINATTSQPVNLTVTMFNLGCSNAVTWAATMWDCSAVPNSALTAESTTSVSAVSLPVDWVRITGQSNGVIAVGSTVPTPLIATVDIRQSLFHGGNLSALLPPTSSPTILLGSQGLLTVRACLRVSIELSSEANLTLVKDLPLDMTLYDVCPVGSYSGDGTSASGTCLKCPTGTYRDTPGQKSCTPCPTAFPVTLTESATSASQCVTAPGAYTDLDGSKGSCSDLGPGVQCIEQGLTLISMPLSPGYWRASSTSKTILSCQVPAYCSGGVGTPPLATNAPTTLVPTTRPTTSESPSTLSPSSGAPTTSRPTSLKPTSVSPTSASPFTTIKPSHAPSLSPVMSSPSHSPLQSTPTFSPSSSRPTGYPTTGEPTTSEPTTAQPFPASPTVSPIYAAPTISPIYEQPSQSPSKIPSTSPELANPSLSPSTSPSRVPSISPSFEAPTSSPSAKPTSLPTSRPTTTSPISGAPTLHRSPTSSPTTDHPSRSPTVRPTSAPSTHQPNSNAPSSTSPTTAAPVVPLNAYLSSDYCIPHHHGPQCLICAPGYVRRGQAPCAVCDSAAVSQDRVRVVALLLLACLLVLIVAFFLLRRRVLPMLRKQLNTLGPAVRRRASITTNAIASVVHHHPLASSASPPAMPEALVPPMHVEPSRVPSMTDVRRSKSLESSEPEETLTRDESGTGRSQATSKSNSKRLGLLTSVRTYSMRARKAVVHNIRPDLVWAAVLSVDSNQVIRIILSFFQVLGGISRTFTTLYPPILTNVVSVYTAFSAEIFYNIDFGCLVTSNHYLSLILNIAAPLVAIGLLGLMHLAMELRLRRLHSPEEAIHNLRVGSFGLFLFILFLIYPGVSSTVLVTFSCRSFDDGTSVLATDYTISCDADDRQVWLGVAAFGVILYVVGIPLIYSVAIWRVRHKINPPDGSAPDSNQFASVLILTEVYKREYYWFEIFELIRKLVQTSLIVFFLNGSVLQLIVMMAVSMFCIHLMYELQPYTNDEANRLAIVCQEAILFVCFLGLLLRVSLTSLDGSLGYDKSTLISAWLVVALFAPLGVAVFQKRRVLFDLGGGLCSRKKAKATRQAASVSNRMEDDISLQPGDSSPSEGEASPNGARKSTGFSLIYKREKQASPMAVSFAAENARE